MTKQNKKTTETKKQNKKETAKKENIKTFLEYTASGDSIIIALNKTKTARRIFLEKHYKTTDFIKAVESLANKYGYSRNRYDFLASYPLKSDLAKIRTIAPFKDKQRETTTPRMITALVIAYLNRESDNGFNRIFPSGLFLENGCLTDLLTAGLIKTEKGENEQQSFLFVKDKFQSLFKDKTLATLENTLANAGTI